MTLLSRLRGKYLICAIQLAFFLGLVLCYRFARDIYDAYLSVMGGIPTDGPFTDLNYVFVALDCVRHGVNPYFDTSCLPRGQYFVYAPALLLAAVLPVSGAWTMIAGPVLDLVFFLSLLLLPQARSRREFGLRLLGALSSMVAYAAVAANIDIVLFVMTIAAVSLLALNRGGRFWAYPIIAVAAAAKLYPAVLLGLALRERLRVLLVIAALAILAAAAYIAAFHAVLPQMSRHLPTGPYLMNWFGAVNLPYGIAEILRGLAPGAMANPTVATMVPLAIAAGLLVATLAQVASLTGAPDFRGAYNRLEVHDKLPLVAGSLIMVGCFFAWQNLGYRGIYLLLVLPGLAALSRQTDGPAKATGILVVFLMWTELVRHGLYLFDRSIAAPGSVRFVVEIGFWLAKEVIWWRVIAVLGAIVTCFVLEAPGLRLAARRVAPAAR